MTSLPGAFNNIFIRLNGANRVMGVLLVPVVMVVFVLVVTFIVFVSGTREELPMRCTGHIINEGVSNNRSACLPVGMTVTNMLPVVFTVDFVSVPSAVTVFAPRPTRKDF